MKMDNRLQSENFSLRQELEGLLHEARQNEDKMRRFDQLERCLIGATSLVELVRLLLSEYKSAFGVEYVTLALVDRESEASRILEVETRDDEAFAGLILLQSPDCLNDLYRGEKPSLGRFDRLRHASIFKAPAGAIASVALLPLMRQGELIGGLHFGSSDPERYAAGFGTDFLERLSAIIGVCLQSALNQERLKLVGLTDGLTGVQNRRYFEHRCLVEISQARRYKHPLVCMFLDIDHFKRINDTWGHQSGDEVLRSVAAAIQGQLRAGDTIARYGGEEFVVLLPQAASQHALEIAERIRAGIARRHFASASAQLIPVTISIGLATLAPEAPDSSFPDQAAQLVAAADKALYQAKHAGRNRVISEVTARPATASPSLTTWRQGLSLLSTRLRRSWRACTNSRPAFR